MIRVRMALVEHLVQELSAVFSDQASLILSDSDHVHVSGKFIDVVLLGALSPLESLEVFRTRRFVFIVLVLYLEHFVE